MDHPRIVQTPDSCFGQPRIAGTRLPVASLVEAVVAEGGLHEAAQAYACDVEDVKAALLYAAEQLWGSPELDDLFHEGHGVIAAE